MKGAWEQWCLRNFWSSGQILGSTSGGLKVSRFILWLRIMKVEVVRLYRPGRVFTLRLNGYKVPEGTRGQLFVIFTGAVAVAAFSSYFLCALEPGKSIHGCVSAVIACMCNIGPAFGEFGPTKNYGDLSIPGTMMLPFLMILGRLEYVAVLALFSKMLWKRY